MSGRFLLSNGGWINMVIMNKSNQYEKHHSFSSFYSSHDVEGIEKQLTRAKSILSEFCANNLTSKYTPIYTIILDDLKTDK